MKDRIDMPELPHFISIAEDGVYEFYIDHTIMASARMCEARFWLDHVEGYKPKTLPWALDFGTLVHSCLEYFHAHEMSGEKLELRAFLEYGAKLWRDGMYDKYVDLPQFKAVGGFQGFIILLTQYQQYYSPRTNLKPIALEIPFGRNKEVPILDNPTIFKWAPFRIYLSGKMDIIFDDGRRLGPMDHKTFSMVGKNPMTGYEVQEGMTGYIYAMNYIYKKHFAHLIERDTNVLWLNFILTKGEADLNKKFQRVPLYKTASQLEEYRLRQISTCAKIYQMIIDGRTPDFNASVCTNYWHSVCHYQPVHRLSSKEDQLIILGKDFKKEIWNPEG